jgi:integrase
MMKQGVEPKQKQETKKPPKLKGSNGVYRRGRIWYAVVTYPRDAQGKYPRKWIGPFATKKQAEAAREEERVEIRKGKKLSSGRITVGELLAMHLSALKTSPEKKAIKTLERYAELHRLHIIPYLGDRRAEKIEPETVHDLYNELDKRGLDGQTIRHVHARLRAAFYWGIRYDKVKRNIFAERKVDQPREKESNAKARSPEEVVRVLVVAAGTQWSAAVYIAIRLGLRRSEILGLKWSDINYRTSVLIVKRGLSETKEFGIIETDTKPHRRKELELTDDLVAFFKAHRVKKAADAAKIKGNDAIQGITSDDYIITNDKLARMKPEALTKAFKRMALKAKLPPEAHLHEMRHSCATWQLESGVDIVTVAENMGHSKPMTTVNIYGHSRPGQKVKAIDIVGQKLRDAQGVDEGGPAEIIEFGR